MRYPVFILLFVVLLGSANLAQAQFNIVDTQVNLELVPENPGPNESIQASINSYATNINAAKISWAINGKVIKSGIGEKVLTFMSGDVGTKTNLVVVIETTEGEVITKSTPISPSTVDLIWQSESLVPPFYKGKALFSHQNQVTVIAVPHIAGSNGEISSKNLIYTWKKDEKVMESDSGYGKSTFTFVGSLISRPVKIEVSVSNTQGNSSAYSHIDIKPTEPLVIFYKVDPLYGIGFQKALSGDTNIDDISEISVLGLPLFFGVDDPKSPNLTYKWSVNSSDIKNTPSANIQVFRKKEGTVGKSKITLSLENSSKVLQYSSGSFDLTFNNPQN